MYWLKAALIGALGSLVMFIIMMAAIHGAGVAPFNIPPSAAFLERLGLNVGPLPLLAHFGYGAFWSIVFASLFKKQMNVWRGLGLAAALWLFMMIAYSPIIGWGVFGFGATERAAEHALHLGSPVKYVIATAVLHAVYGLVIGLLNPLWLHRRQPQSATPTLSSA